jgi:hypothetical protein
MCLCPQLGCGHWVIRQWFCTTTVESEYGCCNKEIETEKVEKSVPYAFLTQTPPWEPWTPSLLWGVTWRVLRIVFLTVRKREPLSTHWVPLYVPTWGVNSPSLSVCLTVNHNVFTVSEKKKSQWRKSHRKRRLWTKYRVYLRTQGLKWLWPCIAPKKATVHGR